MNSTTATTTTTAGAAAAGRARARWLIRAAAGAMACAALQPAATALAQDAGSAGSRPDAADAQAPMPVDIAAQPLAQALIQLSRQTGADITAPSRVTRGKTAPAVNGNYTVPQALNQLLAGTTLSARPLRPNAWLVESPGETLAAAGNASGRKTASSYGEQAAESSAGVSEILVVGSRSQNVDVRRTENDVQPYVVFSSEEIQHSNSTNIEEFLHKALPMNAQKEGMVDQPLGSDAASTFTGRFDLRGLGQRQTLVLVDGRRIPSSASGFGLEQGNVNVIPIAAIERIEVLPSTASAIYGGGASGGVINIILKRDYSGLDLSGNYGNTFDSAAAENSLSIRWGKSIGNGSTHLLVSYSQSARSALDSSERDFYKLGGQRLLENNPNASSLVSVFGANSNISTSPVLDTAWLLATGSRRYTYPNLVFDPEFGGASLGAPRTFVPQGYLGPSSDSGAALLANAGQLNFDPPNARITYKTRSNYASVSIDHEFGKHIQLYGDFSIDSVRLKSDAPYQLPIKLEADSPYNPFQQSITVNMTFPNVISYRQSKLTTIKIVGGIKFKLPFSWTGNVEYDLYKTKDDQSQIFNFGPTANGSIVLSQLALGSIDPVEVNDTAFDIEPISRGPVRSTQKVATVRLGGGIFSVPGGVVKVTMLAEHDENRIAEFTDSIIPSLGNLYPAARRTVNSLYTELRAPIISPTNNIKLVNTLEFMGSVRYDDYDTRFAKGILFLTSLPLPSVDPSAYVKSSLSSVDYTIGLKYKPIADVTIRASYATGFTPPNLNFLVPVPGASSYRSPLFRSVLDPKRGGTALTGNPNSTPAGLIATVAGGNPELLPETLKSLSLGMIVEPKRIPGFRMSADYTVIRKRNEIGFISGGVQSLLLQEDSYPGRVTRGPNLPTDPSGWAGPIIGIDQSAINIGRTNVRSLDIQLDYRLDTKSAGVWKIYAVGTRNFAYEKQLDPSSVAYDSIGFYDGPLKSRGVVGLDWTKASWSAGLNGQYYPSYSVLLADPVSQQFNEDREASQGASNIRSQIYVDGYLSYQFKNAFGQWLLRDLELGISIQNILNKRPPIVTASGVGSYSTYGDPRLRRFSISVRKHF